ncbi:MAG: hypothetical protein HYY03_09265 [Chloroflexi bacterium]|nr:hypothetical protein [Chloroflexota bacterium]
MARYLVVAHQTAGSPELSKQVEALAASDPGAEFVLLVPTTPVQHLLTWVEGEARAVAERAAEVAQTHLEAAGARVLRAGVGDSSPMLAIEDELRDNPGLYDALVICTLPAGVSRWLRLDLPHQAERKFALPVIHVVAAPRVAAAKREPA